jgi:FMN phosphatase YigB (HAD superfamily)
MVGKTFIFDLDDTLIRTQRYYDRAMLKFIQRLQDAMGHDAPGVDTILSKQREIDSQLIQKLGFGDASRYPTSFVKCYSELCNEKGAKFSQKTATELYRIGASALEPERYIGGTLLAGAKETLDFLLKQRSKLIIFTKGAEHVQQEKIAAFKLGRWFKEARIVSMKTNGELAKIVGSRAKKNCYSVGDSFNSDIKTALEIGIGGIYIPYESWRFERYVAGEELPNKERLFELKKLTDIIENYSKF